MKKDDDIDMKKDDMKKITDIHINIWLAIASVWFISIIFAFALDSLMQQNNRLEDKIDKLEKIITKGVK